VPLDRITTLIRALVRPESFSATSGDRAVTFPQSRTEEVSTRPGSIVNGDPAIGAIVREGERVRLRRHVPANRKTFQQWYADPEIATLLRHDLRPLNERQSRGHFDTMILPLSAAGYCFAIHDRESDTLIGSTALTETDDDVPHARMFRVLIGDKSFWDKGYGTEATRLVVDEAFETLGLTEVRLEVFAHNPRAITVYERVGFERSGERREWLGPDRPQLHVLKMRIRLPDSSRNPG
jgi:RimJ/RimL family protein N-acetyltransferase